MTGDVSGCRKSFRFHCAKRGNGRSENRGLRVSSKLKIFFVSFEAQPRKRKLESVICFFKYLFRGGKIIRKILSHSYGLAALAGKDVGHFGFWILDFGFL